MSQIAKQEFVILFGHELWAAAIAIRKFADLLEEKAPSEKLNPAAWDAIRCSHAALSTLVERCEDTVRVQLLLAPSNIFQTILDGGKPKKKDSSKKPTGADAALSEEGK